MSATSLESEAGVFTLGSLFFLSFSIIGLQLGLMRSLTYQKYYHFFYLVISIALLGFGASGTFLSFLYPKIEKRFGSSMTILYGLFSGSMLLCTALSAGIPLDFQYLLFSAEQVLLLAAYVLLIFVPFFLGACIIGILLTRYGRAVSTVYGANLLGSGAGAVSSLGLMRIVPPQTLPVHIALYAFLAFGLWLAGNYREYYRDRKAVFLVCAAFIATAGSIIPMIRIQGDPDDYKPLAYFLRLQAQGDAVHVASEYSSRGVIDVFSSPVFHHTLFASPGSVSTPPDQLAVLRDGELVGVLFDTDRIRETRVMAETPQSVVYRMSNRPRVLLLGDSGNTNIWLAWQYEAEHITLVNGDDRIIRLIRESLPAGRDVTFVNTSPRLYLEAHRGTVEFDIIQIAVSEGMPASGSGLGSLYEDYLLTRESISGMMDILSPDGFITITRGVQTPPRDNIKVFNLFSAVLEDRDLNPGQRLLQGRNYLAVCTLLSGTPLPAPLVDSFIRECREITVDPEYYPGMKDESLQYTNTFEGEGDREGSWFYRAALAVTGGRREIFEKEYLFDVTVPEDDSPYFHHFFRWKALHNLRRAYGRSWFRQVELGYVFLIIVLAVLVCVSFILILVPLVSKKNVKSPVYRKRGVVYFLCIGLAFMFLETVYIQRFILALSEPVLSTSAIITAVLCGAGAGSIFQGKMKMRTRDTLIAAFIGAGLITLMLMVFSGPLVKGISQVNSVLRFTAVIGLVSIPAFFMGWFFPAAISFYRKHNPSFIPLAWGVNGFASVIASPLAVLLAVSTGFSLVMISAIVLYGIAVLMLLPVGKEKGGIS